MKTNFEEWLENKCFQLNPTVLDDDMPYFFNNWISGLDSDDWFKYGEDFCAFQLEIALL